MDDPGFTPGPWSVSDENRDDLKQMARFGNIVVYAEHDCGVHPIADCSCNGTCRSEDEQVANARLIAAAPEMYKALLKVRQAVDNAAYKHGIPAALSYGDDCFLAVTNALNYAQRGSYGKANDEG